MPTQELDRQRPRHAGRADFQARKADPRQEREATGDQKGASFAKTEISSERQKNQRKQNLPNGDWRSGVSESKLGRAGRQRGGKKGAGKRDLWKLWLWRNGSLKTENTGLGRTAKCSS